MIYDITPSQQAMVLHQTVHPSDNSFDLAFLWKLTGSVDINLLREVIDHVIGEMKSFRTSFNTMGGRLNAEVHQKKPRTETVEMPSKLSDDEADRWVQKYLSKEVEDGPFPLSSVSQVRCVIMRTNSATYVTLRTAHIAGDVYACYEMLNAVAFCWDSPRLQWGKISARLREHPGTIPPGTVNGSALGMLQKLYSGIDSFSNVDIAYVRTEGRMLGHRESFQIPPEILTDLRRSEVYSEFGPVAVFYAAYAYVVHRICATNSFIVGIPMADRSGVNGRAASGFFVNTLPLPLQVSRETTWFELITQIRDGLSLFQRARSIYPLTVHRESVCPQVANPTIDNAVTYYKRELKPSFTGLQTTSIPVRRSAVSYPVMVTFADEPDAVTVEFSFMAALENANLSSELITALRLIADDAATPIISPDYESVAEVDAADPASVLESVWDRIQNTALGQPNRTAIRADRSFNYQELVAETKRFAAGLKNADASQHVVLNLPKSSESVIAFLGIIASGRVCIPIDPSTPASRLQHILQSLVDLDGRVITVVSDSDSSHPAHGLSECHLQNFGDFMFYSAEQVPECPNRLADTAYVIFTSGSTGRPKGVDVGHGGLLPLFDSAASTMHLSNDDTWIWLHSSSFDYSIWEIFCPLSLGAVLCIPNEETQRDPVALANYLALMRVTVLCETPAGLKRFGKLVTESRSHFSSIRVLTVGGEAFSARELEPWRTLIMSGPAVMATLR